MDGLHQGGSTRNGVVGQGSVMEKCRTGSIHT